MTQDSKRNEMILNLVKKLEKISPEFIDSINSSSAKDLESSMSIYSKHREDTSIAKQSDEALNDAKDQVKELSAPYNETQKILKLKIKLIHLMLKEKNG